MDIELQYEEKQRRPFISGFLFWKFKLKASAHYKVNQWEQWCFLGARKPDPDMLAAAIFCQPRHSDHFPTVFYAPCPEILPHEDQN